ncbi:MAG: Hsp20/alpha crystallin family protein [Planctomycetaceae bacterium]
MSEYQTRPESRITASADKLRREFDRWLEAAFSQGERALDVIGLRGDRPWSPGIDVIETVDAILVEVELPGVDPSTVDITLVGNMLTIKGTAPVRPTLEGQAVHLVERKHGSFDRSIPLPAPADPEKVSAEASLGVLHIRIAKADAVRPRQIRVNAGPTI